MSGTLSGATAFCIC